MRVGIMRTMEREVSFFMMMFTLLEMMLAKVAKEAK